MLFEILYKNSSTLQAESKALDLKLWWAFSILISSNHRFCWVPLKAINRSAAAIKILLLNKSEMKFVVWHPMGQWQTFTKGKQQIKRDPNQNKHHRPVENVINNKIYSHRFSHWSCLLKTDVWKLWKHDHECCHFVPSRLYQWCNKAGQCVARSINHKAFSVLNW